MAVARLVRRLGISGLWGADFVLTPAGAAYLIEVNPRATPVCHLPLGPGRDLPTALVSMLQGGVSRAPPAGITQDVIALFSGNLPLPHAECAHFSCRSAVLSSRQGTGSRLPSDEARQLRGVVRRARFPAVTETRTVHAESAMATHRTAGAVHGTPRADPQARRNPPQYVPCRTCESMPRFRLQIQRSLRRRQCTRVSPRVLG
jgi:hypothetical protein